MTQIIERRNLTKMTQQTIRGFKALYEKVKSRCLKNNYSIKELLHNDNIDEMLLIALVKPKLLK